MIKHYDYTLKGTCSKLVSFDIEDSDMTVHNISFRGGCDGGHQFLKKVIEGLNIEKAIEICENVQCAERGTSCADAFAKSLRKVN